MIYLPEWFIELTWIIIRKNGIVRIPSAFVKSAASGIRAYAVDFHR
jgi:hypothetical protein